MSQMRIKIHILMKTMIEVLLFDYCNIYFPFSCNDFLKFDSALKTLEININI